MTDGRGGDPDAAAETAIVEAWGVDKQSSPTKIETGEQRTPADRMVHRLHHSRARRVIVEVVPDETWPEMYRVAWPDIDISPPANLARCMEAAQAWAASETLKDLRKKRGVGALKSLPNFSWSWRRIEQSSGKVARTQKTHFTQSGEVRP